MPDGVLHGESVPVEVPGSLLPLVAACPGTPVFYWEQPARRCALAAVGAVREIRAAGPERFRAASRAATALLSSIEARGCWNGGHVVGGFGFSDHDSRDAGWHDFPAARLVLPELLWIRNAGQCVLTRVWEAGRERENDALLERVRAVAGSRPKVERRGLTLVTIAATGEQSQWRARVEAARALIAQGAARKVVIARRRELLADSVPDPARILAHACATRPACFSFWVRHGGPSFVGSTPELLARRAGDRLEASALAGSAARGTNAAEDEHLGSALLACPKNAREHEMVVSAVRSALAGITERVTLPAQPGLLRLPEAQHLYTPMSGRLAQPLTVLEIAGLLHPTPAVCGVPRKTARTIIEHDEPQRGWYAGAVGWMAASGDGELAVALRSALVDDRRITIWAGAGIVEGSDADTELAETEAKMTALFRSIAGHVDECAA